MTDTPLSFHERESQVAPPVRSGESAHTPTPWLKSNGPIVRAITKNHAPVADCGFRAEGEANAAFIVRAVNSHADMLAALQNLLTWKDGNENVPPGHNGDEPWGWARAAISKATGAAS